MIRMMFHLQNKSILTSNVKFGRLYNFPAIGSDIPAQIYPSGWDIPSDAQWATLASFLSTDPGNKLKSPLYWDSPSAGVDTYGYKAYPTGIRSRLGIFSGINQFMQTFSSSSTFTDVYIRSLAYNSSEFQIGLYHANGGRLGLSIRLVYTGPGTPDSTLTDYDGNVYDVIQIGTQYWLKQNWACTHYNEGSSITLVTSSTIWAAATSSNRYYCNYDNNITNVFK